MFSPVFSAAYPSRLNSLSLPRQQVYFQSSAIQNPEKHADALKDAVFLHRNRPLRSGEGTPYFAHQEGVESLIFKHGGTETEALAGLFHDGIEKDGAYWGGSNKEEMFASLAKKHGPAIANLVLECTDPSGFAGNDKKAAKGLLMVRQPHLSTPGGRLVKMADLLDNLQALQSSIYAKGLEQTFQNFRGIDGPSPVANSYRDYLLLTKAFLTLEGIKPQTKNALMEKIETLQTDDVDLRTRYRMTLLFNFIEAVEKYYALTAEHVAGVQAIGPVNQVFEEAPTYEAILKKLNLLTAAESNYPQTHQEVLNLKEVIAKAANI
jgi:hypothetical protein